MNVREHYSRALEQGTLLAELPLGVLRLRLRAHDRHPRQRQRVRRPPQPRRHARHGRRQEVQLAAGPEYWKISDPCDR